MKFCKLSRLRWAGHVIRQGDDDLSRRALLSEPGGKGHRRRPRLRWEDGVKEDAAKLRCRNCIVVILNWEGWRKLLKEAEAHPGAVVPLGGGEREIKEVFQFGQYIRVTKLTCFTVFACGSTLLSL